MINLMDISFRDYLKISTLKWTYCHL